MKLLSTFETLPTITASSSAAGYPVSNVALVDPGKVWQVNTFGSGNNAWFMVDFGAAKALNALFLNNCNFASATIQGNATDSWTSPSFSQSVSLGRDDCQVRKGFFALTGFNYRYLRGLITFQTLDNAGLYPFVGNLIVGTSSSVRIAEWQPQKIKRYSVFQPDGGSFTKTPKGISRHVFNVSQTGTLAEYEAQSWDWTYAVFFEDLGYPAGVWLVYHPEDLQKTIKSVTDVSWRYSVPELV